MTHKHHGSKNERSGFPWEPARVLLALANLVVNIARYVRDDQDWWGWWW